MARILSLVGIASVALFAACAPGIAGETMVKAPVPAMMAPVRGATETAVLAGGCFWGVQGVFSHVKGVIRTSAGYAGGTRATAHYETVSSGSTGHAESVRIVFNPAKVNYADLLRIYFSVVADPTTLNRQGPDEGTQYRTAIFPQSPDQEKVARAYIAQLTAAHVYKAPIVTRIERNAAFFPAEEHHQDFMARNPDHPYILINDRPKVEALKRLYPGAWRG